MIREKERLQRQIVDLDPIEAAIKALILREEETFVAGSLAPVAVPSAPAAAPAAPASPSFAPVAMPSAPVEDSFNDFGSKEVRSPVKQSQWGEFLNKGGSSRSSGFDQVFWVSRGVQSGRIYAPLCYARTWGWVS